jgi:hypothetical protein
VSQAAATFEKSETEASDGARIRRRAILSCAVGNFVELFDFLIFGLFAAQIGANLFPAADPASQVLSAAQSFSSDSNRLKLEVRQVPGNCARGLKSAAVSLRSTTITS